MIVSSFYTVPKLLLDYNFLSLTSGQRSEGRTMSEKAMSQNKMEFKSKLSDVWTPFQNQGSRRPQATSNLDRQS